jgi:hypothetical protein
MTKKIVKLTETELKEYVKETVATMLESSNDIPLRVEDFFDISSLSKQDLLSIAFEIKGMIGGRGYDSNITENGNIIFEDSSNHTMTIKELRKELQKLGFKQWQIKTTVSANKVRILILFVDIGSNIEVIENKMLACGWTKAKISDPVKSHNIVLRVMEFDPKEQKTATKEARRYRCLYHLTPFNNYLSIVQKGLETRNDNEYLSYPPRLHLLKGDITKQELSEFGWHLYNRNSNLKNGRYALLKIDMSKVPENIEFYGDPRFERGYFTKQSIPPKAITIIGDIRYKDKFNYNYEQINFLVPNDRLTF